MQLIKSLGVAWQVARKDAMHAKCPILQTGKDVLHARRPILHDGMDSIVQWSPCRGLDGQHKNPGVDSQGYEYQHLYSDVDIAHVIFRYLKPSDEILLLRE